jgi:hypothetical protein
MVRGLAVLLICAITVFAQEPDTSFEIEPEILPQNLKDDAALQKSSTATAVPSVEKLEKDLERARRSAASAERFYKIGALAKTEAEARFLKVVRLEADLQSLRLTDAKAQVLADQNSNEPTPQASVKSDAVQRDVDLARAIEAAHAAAAKREQAELEAAENNLQRQQKLLALGSGHKAAVAKAEQKLTELKQARSGAP